MIKMSHGKKKSCYTSLCSHVRTKWPVVLLIFSFSLLFLIVYFKWVALDWIIDEKVAEVSIKIGNYFFSFCYCITNYNLIVFYINQNRM